LHLLLLQEKNHHTCSQHVCPSLKTTQSVAFEI
jgi:hypothetical protein